MHPPSAHLPPVHLHVHSTYSLLGATATVDALAARAAADGLSHLALTDDNALYGVVAFDRACRAHGVTPIVGMAVNVQPLDGVDTLGAPTPGRLILLAANAAGYRALARLSSHLQGAPDRHERVARGVDWATLKACATGVIGIDGGRQGWVARALRRGDAALAARYAGRLGGIFDERAYLGLEIHTPADHAQALATTELGARFGLPAVALHPIYCLERSHQARLRLLAAIDRNCRLDAVPDHLLPDENDPAVELHWPTPQEMAARYAQFPAALAATHAIAAQCEPALPDGRPIWPAPPLPAGVTPADALRALAEEGLVLHYGPTPAAVVRARLTRELDAIERHGFTPLFLVVADVVRFARGRGVPVSTRGSVADSLAAFCVGITTVDPVRHDLLFERFLNPARTSLPDIDLDFCSRRRDEVLAYVRTRYGEAQTALVATVSTMKPKSAVRETAKAYGLDDATVARLIKLLPGGRHPDPRRRDKRTVDDVLAKLADPHLRHVIRAAYELVGQPHHLSIHPGGVIVTPGPVTDYAPVQWTAKGFLITQFDHGDVEAIGLPKLDLLGIRALTVLADATALVQAHHAPDFALEAIPLDDGATGDLLARAETVGIFQCESTGAQRTLRQLQARTVQDLAVANAFFKPGPATGGMAQTFVRRYRGEEPTRYLHPALEPVLHSTKGVLIFQEQVLRIATEIAGLAWDEAEHLRRGMSKFQPEEMTAMRTRFVEGCRRPPPDGPGFTQAQAETLWQQVEAFAGYGFNQGHATAYADVSYRSAYLKAHWPAAFLCARLKDWGGFHHQAVYIAEAQRLGIAVRPPHVNHSGRKFTLAFVEGAPVLWMGLGQVRDLRRQAVAAVITARRERPFTGVRELLLRVELQAKEVRHLIQCGALDGLGTSRAAMLAESADLARAGSAAQMGFDFGAPAVPPEDVAARIDWEQHILGLPVSANPVAPADASADPPPSAVALRDVRTAGNRAVTTVATRLPGWTGGKGFFVGDGTDYMVAIPADDTPTPRPWQPLVLRGRMQRDAWGSEWFAVEGLRVVG